MKILVLNSGSSSVKYKLFDLNYEEKVLSEGLCERIGLDGAKLIYKNYKGFKLERECELKNHESAVRLIIKNLTDKTHGSLENINMLNAIGHRVVHGGKYFNKPVIINEHIKKNIEDCFIFSPLHNKNNLIGIQACENILGDIKQVAVFDTAFCQTLEEKAFLYALPYEYYKKYNIRRYGFHGTSHEYVCNRAHDLLNLKEIKIISCHLGNGSSICAIKNKTCCDISMGLTPLEGLMMGTRSGDIDPGVINFLMQKENLSCEQIDDLLNKKSGVLGISGISSDFRDLESAAKNNNYRAKIALDMFCYRAAKYISAYMAVLNGLDVIIFTAGVGENSPVVREKICAYLNYTGLELDINKNNLRERELEISSKSSKIKVFVIATNEELMIARATAKLME